MKDKLAITLISEILLGEMDRMAQGIITLSEFYAIVDVLERYKFTEEHNDFFPAIMELADKVFLASKDWNHV